MKNTSKFVLNLSRQKISLGIISEHRQLEILDAFDPNEPAGIQSLKRLFLLAKALSNEIPLVEVFLPNDIITYETFISDSPNTPEEVKSVLAERKRLPISDLQVTLGEEVGSRAISVAFVETSVLEELRNFITQAGFKIKCFRAGKKIAGFSDNHELFPEYKYLKKNSITQNSMLKFASATVFLALGIFLLSNFSDLHFNGWQKEKFYPPEINTELVANLSEFHSLETSLTEELLKDFNLFTVTHSKEAPSLIQKVFWNPQGFQVSQNDLSPNLLEEFVPAPVSRSGIQFEVFSLNSNQTETPQFNSSEIIKEAVRKKLILFQSSIEITSLLESYEEDKFLLQNTINPTSEILNESKNDVSRTEISSTQINQFINKPEPISEANIIVETRLEKNVTPPKESPGINIKTEETPPELEQIAMEYAMAYMPYKKPLIIDSIRILSEPTLSTGALVYLEAPLSRPDLIVQSKRIKSSEVSLKARATQAPSIPKNASVGHNSTKRNFIDLDRTNLIGIIGRTSNPRAMVRLANGKILTLKVGDGFQGWRVFAIDRDKIHVENGTRQEILHLPG